MRTVMIDKGILLKECQSTLGYRYGIENHEDLLDHLCGRIKDHYTDRKRVHELVFGNTLFKNNNVPYPQDRTKLFIFLMDLRGLILDLIHEQLPTKNKHVIRFVPTDSRMSLSFRIFD